MGYFNLGIGRIQDIVDGCTYYVLEGAYFYGALGLFAGFLLVLIINLVPVFKPKTKFFKVLNLFNFIYFPALFALALGGLGGLYHGDNFIKKEIKETMVPMTKLIFPAFQIYLATDVDVKNTDITLNDAIENFTSSIKIKPKDDSWLEQQKVRIANDQVPKGIGWGIQSVVDAEIVDRGYENVRRLEVANHMSFLKLRYIFWRDVEERTQAYSDRYFMQQYLKLLFLVFGFGSLFIFQIMVLLFRPKE